MFDTSHPLYPIIGQWHAKIRLAWEAKRKLFQDDADECMKFFNGPYDFLYGLKTNQGGKGFVYTGDMSDAPRPTFGMTINKTAELVQLFGPALYHRNPVRKVNPRKQPVLPPEAFGVGQNPAGMLLFQKIAMKSQAQQTQDQARAALLEHYLNWTPAALDLKTESRFAIVEALIKGAGLLMPEVHAPEGSTLRLVGSFNKSIDDLVIDPDAERLSEAKWVALRYTEPYWQVEETYQLPPESLKKYASGESSEQQSQTASDPNGDYNRKRGITNDTLTYWKVYSKMGFGGRLSGLNQAPDAPLRQATDPLGKFLYLVICEGCPYPINVPPEITAALINIPDLTMQQMAQQEVMRRCQWPTPYWADDAWPFTMLAFHPVPRQTWPMSHLKPGLGELKAINWIWSMLVSKIRTACRDFIGVMKAAGEELKNTIKSGGDYEIIEIEQMVGSIDQAVKFLQHPTFNPEIYTILTGLMNLFDKRTGLTELLYGLSATQMRSAEEAAVKGEQVNIRPDDMADRVENWMTDVSRMEAFCARWHLTGQDVAPAVGEAGAWLWDQLISASNPGIILHQQEYRIEAGSARKPNRAREANNMQQAMQQLFLPLLQYSQASGDVVPVNALMAAWARSIDLEAGPFVLKPPPPPPMPPAANQAV